MRNNLLFSVISCKIILISNIILIVLCVFNTSSQLVVKNLCLNEGDICRKCQRPEQVYVCTVASRCKALKESIRTRNYLDICKFVGLEPVVCCPVTANEPLIEKLADKKCLEYFKLAETLKSATLSTRTRVSASLMSAVGGTPAKIVQFPHMALIGFGDTTEDREDWRCGGSLISERWILTAAHCKQMSSGDTARWARLGVSERDFTESSVAQPKDYRIVQHITHPDYKPPSLYNDIALFRLERDVEFSKEVRPICLNSDPFKTPLKQIVTGWGRISTAGPLSDNLLKVDLDIFPIKQCNESYFSNNNPSLQFGILSDSMICAGSFDGEKDSCSGDSGGPLQLEHVNYKGMYTQYGITSFGKFCGDKNTPGVYTRVAKYMSWIEKIVF